MVGLASWIQLWWLRAISRRLEGHLVVARGGGYLFDRDEVGLIFGAGEYECRRDEEGEEDVGRA